MHKFIAGMFAGLLGFVIVAALLATAAPAMPAQAQGDTGTASCPNWRHYVYATKPDTNLDTLRAEINDLPGHFLPENGRYWVEDIVSVQVLYFPSGEYQLVALLYVQDMCRKP